MTERTGSDNSLLDGSFCGKPKAITQRFLERGIRQRGDTIGRQVGRRRTSPTGTPSEVAYLLKTKNNSNYYLLFLS
ncbi:hypothetical protein E2C01_003716 [Portunus trituberculatus]|uniref:Uncharacterized protein n=1 Tax=Portunus trituberculatus TaxID=210409 RepID=A0A5B7CUA0_PORTR|nr:hypothetical protein [Portunus trituberculatus]